MSARPLLYTLPLLIALGLAGCAAPPGETGGRANVGSGASSAGAVTGDVVLAPEDMTRAGRRARRVVLPAAMEGPLDRPLGLLMVSGKARGQGVLAPVDGVVLVDGAGGVMIDHISAVEWDRDLFLARGSERDLEGLLAKVRETGASLFQVPMLLDGGRALKGEGVETGPAHRLTLYRDETGALGVVSSGARRPTLKEHLDALSDLKARDAVALDPQGLTGVIGDSSGGVRPLGDRAGGFLVLDFK